MDLEPFLKSVNDRVFEKAGVPRHIVPEMQREADNYEKVARETIESCPKKADTTYEGLGAWMSYLINGLCDYRNRYDDEIIRLRAEGKNADFADAWCMFYTYLIECILDMKPGLRDEVREYEHFVMAQRARARR